MSRIPRRLVIAVIGGFVAGVLLLVAARFVTYKSNALHYHANFAVYINGQPEKFDNFTFYEEVASCSADGSNDPKTRAHMHDNNNHLVHVHDKGVTWGHFFANLGFTLGSDVIKTDKGLFISGQNGGELRFILNGTETKTIANQIIHSQDVLLIDYGNNDKKTLDNLYQNIPRDAPEYNTHNDPASCKGSKPLSFGERLKKAIAL